MPDPLRPQLAPEDFALQCTVPETSPQGRWPALLLGQALRQAAPLRPAVRVGASYSWSGPLNIMKLSASRKLLCGLTPLAFGFERHSKGLILRSAWVAYAAWRIKSRELVAWSSPLTPRRASQERYHSMSFELGGGKPAFIDEAVEKALLALAPAAPGWDAMPAGWQPPPFQPRR